MTNSSNSLLAASGEPATHQVAVEMAAIRVVLVEGRALYACALEALLSAEPDMQVTAVVSPDHQFVDRAAGADVAVVDLDMADGDRAAAYEHLNRMAPGCRRIALSGRPLPAQLLGGIAGDVHGLVSKHSSTRVLLEAVRQVSAGRDVVDPKFAATGRSGSAQGLSRREIELLSRAADGSSIADLARQVVLSEGTVRNYLARAASKLGARNRLEAINLARAAGWL
ncbi:MAG TPA: response regulator transcription factor [Sporichthyaceae bacterium]|jgi:two-component system response regulator DesR|nr:response regulator transcription factor [Sporichthyaceae bacterium]